MTDDADRVETAGRRVTVASGGRAEPAAPELPLSPGPAGPPRARRAPLSWDLGSAVRDRAAITGLRANLHELAADVHELAAAIHDLKAEEHEQALLARRGDAEQHRLWADLRRTAAAAEWESARKERHAAEQLRHGRAS